jgi:hypothetical protein
MRSLRDPFGPSRSFGSRPRPPRQRRPSRSTAAASISARVCCRGLFGWRRRGLAQLRCLQAQAGDKTTALAKLRTAVEKGLADVEPMEKNPDLESVRGEEENRTIADGLKKLGSPS